MRKEDKADQGTVPADQGMNPDPKGLLWSKDVKFKHLVFFC